LRKIAIVMSVYLNDSLDHVQEAIDSLFSQNDVEFDILIQEDGQVSNEIHKYLNNLFKMKKIQFLGLREKNLGLAYSLNELINYALKKDYEYIARMDADDISLPNRLKLQFDFMNKNKDIDVVGTNIVEFGNELNYHKKVHFPITHEEMLIFFKKRVPIAHVSSFFRNTFFMKTGLYRTSGHLNNEDTFLWMDGFLSGCKFANIDDYGVKVRISNDFFDRRGGAKKIVSDFMNRLEVNRALKFGYLSTFYSFGFVIMNLLPARLKKIAYLHLRK